MSLWQVIKDEFKKEAEKWDNKSSLHRIAYWIIPVNPAPIFFELTGVFTVLFIGIVWLFLLLFAIGYASSLMYYLTGSYYASVPFTIVLMILLIIVSINLLPKIFGIVMRVFEHYARKYDKDR